MRLFYRGVSPGGHFIPRPAEGMALFVEGKVIRCIFRRFCPPIDIDKSIYIPMFQQFIGWDIVMGRVQTDILGCEAKKMTPKIIQSIQEVQTVMAAGLGKLKHKRKLDLFQVIAVKKHV